MPATYYNPGPAQSQVGTGQLSERQGLANLLQMLQQQGRVDPRLLAQAQAQNSRATQQQMDTARAGAARGGMQNGGLQAALQAAIAGAGANRQANLNYQDIADSYGRNQQNLGLMNQLVQQPNLGYSSLQENRHQFLIAEHNKKQAAQMAMWSSIIGGVGKAAAGGV